MKIYIVTRDFYSNPDLCSGPKIMACFLIEEDAYQYLQNVRNMDTSSDDYNLEEYDLKLGNNKNKKEEETAFKWQCPICLQYEAIKWKDVSKHIDEIHHHLFVKKV